MVLELHVWGPAFGLPSIDAECIAAIAYFHRIVPYPQWVLVANHDTSTSPRREFPVLIDSIVRATGFSAIVSYLRNHRSGAYDLDYNLTHEEQTDRTAFISFLQSTAGPLVDLNLYVSSENYNSTTSSAYTAILPWYTNYTIPPARRDLARARTAHLGLSSLDVNIAEQDGFERGGSRVRSEFEAAKKAAGPPSESRTTQPQTLSMGRGKGIQGLLSSPIYAARFRLDTLTNDLLEPLSNLLGKKDYLLDGGKPSSLDCLAFAYLALMFYPPVPQPWLKEAIQARYSRILRYIWRMREELLGGDEVKAADVWFISSHKGTDAEVEGALDQRGMHLPWRPRPTGTHLSTCAIAVREVASNLPVISTLLRQGAVAYASPPRSTKRVSSSTYSMRQSRAPTASQIQNPPPPASSTKTGRFFGKSNLGHTFRRSAAGAFGPELAKKLSQLVKMEKNVMRSMELVSRERMEVAQQLSIWGEACDDDVSDVTDKLGVLIYEIGELEDQFVDRYDQYRVTIKSIRNIEASVQPSRDRKQKITDNIAQLKYKEPNSPKIVVLEQELVRAEAESLVAEAQLSNITREKLKAAFTYQFDAMREHCEKLAIIAGYGKHLLELVDDTPVTPGETRNAYDGYEASKAIIQDCEDALTNWVQQNASVTSKLSVRARTLSQRRRNAARRQGEGVDLSHQDQPLDNRESGLWIPASEHQGNGYEDEEEEEDAPSTIATETRGREEERPVAA
ncbi:uncharacterized protein BDR25DRAFT_252640 [Lindgomyces ingoldianus]|uniref:Uncharacterized protein n=1 Tax=Lindgomyces ingoldianus TaxID=673940 RepID=A0ACB6RDK1_9PLEO|nr:uncharacterized protein BDR25DRAFT_252640 [Lindgomyces ingoldianus]KAF2476556.1 hypothetical protein BDR25DRAFT_252640 [Lindgomyces ingoldianus]